MAEAVVVGVEKENVLIQAGACSLTILPHFGGKIASLRIHDRELLQAPLVPYAPRTQTMRFDEADASGWDECLPSVAACTVETPSGPASIPDHGDLWRVVWQPVQSRPNSATLRGTCVSLPLALERTLALAKMAAGWRLSLDYKVTNTGSHSVPWSWSAHPLFSVAPGDRIMLPDSVRELRLEGSGGNRLGQAGDRVAWPIATLSNGDQTNLAIAQSPSSAIGDKLFTGPLSPSESWAQLERPSAGLRIKVSFDPAATPYLGLWICYGGWPSRPGLKQMCIAIEPSTAPVDSLAQTGPWSRSLAPGQSYEWPMIVELEPI